MARRATIGTELRTTTAVQWLGQRTCASATASRRSSTCPWWTCFAAALGCVILIWLINLRDSKQHQEQTALLLEQQKRQIAELEKMRDALKQQTADQAGAVQTLDAKLQAATVRADDLQAQLKTSGKDLDAARAGADDLSHKLAEARGKIDALQAVADAVPGLRGDLKKAQDQYTADEAKLPTPTKT